MNDFEKECKRCNVEKWKKALRIAEIRADKICTYEQAEQIYNDEKSKNTQKSHSQSHDV